MLLVFVLTLLDKPVTVLFVVLRPVDSELMPVEVDVERLLTLVDSELAAVSYTHLTLPTILLV